MHTIELSQDLILELEHLSLPELKQMIDDNLFSMLKTWDKCDAEHRKIGPAHYMEKEFDVIRKAKLIIEARQTAAGVATRVVEVAHVAPDGKLRVIKLIRGTHATS